MEDSQPLKTKGPLKPRPSEGIEISDAASVTSHEQDHKAPHANADESTGKPKEEPQSIKTCFALNELSAGECSLIWPCKLEGPSLECVTNEIESARDMYEAKKHHIIVPFDNFAQELLDLVFEAKYLFCQVREENCYCQQKLETLQNQLHELTETCLKVESCLMHVNGLS
jgi:hypothetical protein